MNQLGVLHCEVCDAELQNFSSMNYHIKGKRHQKALEHWKRKQEDAKLSIFVRNFPLGTTEQELWQYFAQFGRVTKVTIVKPTNRFSIIEFSNVGVVNHVLSLQNHRLNSHNLIVKAREVQIPGTPAASKFQQGYQQFHQGGNFSSVHQGGHGYGMHGAQGYEMDWQGQGQSGSKVNKKRPVVDEQVDQYYHEELMEKLVKVKGVQYQLEWLCQNLQVSAEEAQTKFNLCEKLQEILGKFFPGCTVNQFGSSVNGFGLTGCDMDIYLDLSTMHSRTWEVQPIKLPFTRDFKFLKEKEWGPLIPADVDRMGLSDQCKLIYRILNEHLEGICDSQLVPGNRCPLVRFKFQDIKCDLSLNNRLALQNTKLLYLYSVLNSRVRLLVYAIRYWAKVKKIAGNHKASTKMSNYALTLMVLNYLQTLEPPVLPTIEKLSDLHGPDGRTKIEGWDTTFAMDWQIIPQTSNNQSAAELLSGFFSYWSAFNFSENVLITRSAVDVPFTRFFEKDFMSDARIRQFKTSAMNIQDPLVLSHNITQNVNDKSREVIEREFRIAAIKTSVWGNDGFSMSSPSGGGDLVHLLNDEIPDIILAEEKEKEMEAEQRKQEQQRAKGDYDFEIEMKPTLIGPKLLKQLQQAGNYRVEWCRRACNFVLRTFKDTLLLVVEELPEASEELQKQLEEDEKKRLIVKKHNDEILARRKARREVKKQELMEKLEKEKKEKRIKQEEEEAQREKERKEKEEAGEEEGVAPGEKRPMPPSIFDLDIGAPKRFRGYKPPPRPEPNLDDMIEDSDDGEELIEYTAKEPELRYKKASNSEVNFQYFMRAWCMTWARRKKVKSYLVNEEGRREEGIPMEKLISEAIYQNDQAPLPKPVVGFYCYMDSYIEENETKVIVSLDCKEGMRDFPTFFQFFKQYVLKLLTKHMT